MSPQMVGSGVDAPSCRGTTFDAANGFDDASTTNDESAAARTNNMTRQSRRRAEPRKRSERKGAAGKEKNKLMQVALLRSSSSHPKSHQGVKFRPPSRCISGCMAFSARTTRDRNMGSKQRTMDPATTAPVKTFARTPMKHARLTFAGGIAVGRGCRHRLSPLDECGKWAGLLGDLIYTGKLGG
jgi:hypothetical protein